MSKYKWDSAVKKRHFGISLSDPTPLHSIQRVCVDFGKMVAVAASLVGLFPRMRPDANQGTNQPPLFSKWLTRKGRERKCYVPFLFTALYSDTRTSRT